MSDLKSKNKLETKVVNIKDKFLRKAGFNSVQEWLKKSENVYIGGGSPPLTRSKWQNPYRNNSSGSAEKDLALYENYIKDCIKQSP